MKAGRELDALVAEKIFGYRWLHVRAHWGVWEGGRSYLHARDYAAALLERHADVFSEGCENPVYFSSPAQRHSTDMTAAWRVVEKLIAQGWTFSLHDVDAIRAEAVFSGQNLIPRPSDGSYQVARAVAPTASLAACLAALRAVESTP